METERAHQPDYFSPQIAKARRFCLGLPQSDSPGLAVVCGGLECCTRDYEIHRSTLPFWCIEFVTHGRGRLLLTGQAHDLVPGTVFAYGPGISQDIVPLPGEELVKYFVGFTGEAAQAFIEALGPAPGTVLRSSAPHELVSIFETLIREGMTATPLTPRITALVLEHLILKISQTSISSEVADTPSFATYRKCRRFIETHWMEVENLGQVAAHCHVDEAYICRLFRRFDDQSPYKLLMRLRIARGAEMLLSPGTSVKEVAEALGFADAFHFSRSFKKLMGVPPSAFSRSRQHTE